MVTVSPDLLYKHVNALPIIRRAQQIIEDDIELVELLKMSNLMAVSRLKYNDHGIIHARIVAGAALELVDILHGSGVEMTSMRDGVTSSIDEVKIVVLLSSYLHDIGNSIHRVNHELLGVLVARNIIDRILFRLGFEKRKAIGMRQEILHSIYASNHNIECLSTECGIVKVSDGLDMAEGRARIPYRLGKVDMHAVSALSIRRVDIDRNPNYKRPVNIVVYMSEAAGLFQLEAVLMPKIRSSGLKDLLDIYINVDGKMMKYYSKE